jgi:hypothetical protein
MAFYARTGNTGHIHHVALHVSPKNADAHRMNTWRMHAVNKPDAAYVTQQVWTYDPGTIINRPQGLIALVLLGKTVKDGEELRDVLKAVEIVQEDLSYTCKSWVFGAIEVIQLLQPYPVHSLDSRISSFWLSVNSLNDRQSRLTNYMMPPRHSRPHSNKSHSKTAITTQSRLVITRECVEL